MGKREAQRLLECSAKTIERYTKNGLLAARTHGRYVIFEYSQVQAIRSQLVL